MPKHNIDLNSWTSVKADLNNLIISLSSDFSNNVDPSPISAIMSLNQNDAKEEEWYYNTREINPQFISFKNIAPGKGIIPDISENCHAIEVKISIELESKNTTSAISIEDPIKKLGIGFSIGGEAFNKEEELIKVFSSWHLDREIPTNTDEFIHPMYHFHFGGIQMKEAEEEIGGYGGLLSMGSPRITHVPMDLILAVDFVIQNFYTKENKAAILANNQYITAVRNAQERYWKPYALAFASRWIETFCPKPNNNPDTKSMCGNLQVSFSPFQIFPNLL